MLWSVEPLWTYDLEHRTRIYAYYYRNNTFLCTLQAGATCKILQAALATT
jgi:hypothetical protein